jgi:hypothetical protein
MKAPATAIAPATFEELRQQKYAALPFDNSDNPYGFSFGGTRRPTSNIVAHLPFLEFMASQCDHVTEFGVRDGFSTCALLSGCRGKVVTYDIQRYPVCDILEQLDLPCAWEFHERSTVDESLVIEPTDLLFIDTLHTYDQAIKELALHADKARRYIVFHDTYTFGQRGNVKGTKGLMIAITEFVAANPAWRIAYHVNFNHGLTMLARAGA